MWDATIYDRYSAERTQPSKDLAERIRHSGIRRILDAGCGSGMSTAVLASVWKDAEIIGVDLSEEMLQKARETVPSARFIQRDCREPLSDLGTFDLIFSNAFIQWIPNQEEFIANSLDMLNEHGIFAAQIPLFEEMAASECIKKAEGVNPARFKNKKSRILIHPAHEYYDMLSDGTEKISIWITDYFHQMKSHKRILEFLRGSALRPHIELLSEYEQIEFMAELLKSLKTTYPYQEDGTILFPFKRMFLIGEK